MAAPLQSVRSPMLDRPRRSIRRRLMAWMVVAVIVPTILSIGAFGFIARKSLSKEWESQGKILSQTVAASLEGRISAGLNRHDGELLTSLSHDRRIAFAVIVDRNNDVRHSSVFDAKAFTDFRKGETTWSKTRVAAPGSSETTTVGDSMVVHNTPILSKQGSDRLAKAGAGAVIEASDVEGSLVLGLHQPGIRGVLLNFHLAQAASAVAACLLVLPLISTVMRRWTRPLADLVDVTRRLAEGKPPEPVLVRSMDELGFLACAFNDMASRLMVSRRELIEINESLEQRVKTRTSELHDAMTKLDEMASTDALTHLANRRAFNLALHRHNQEPSRGRDDLIAVLIDLDGFKQVNDTFGHDVGDELLVLAGKVLQKHCRDMDLAARLGGDEFALLLRKTDPDEAAARAQRILEEFTREAATMLERYGSGVPVSMSIGIASRHLTRAESGEQLIQLADHALYDAKGSGKACVRVSRELAQTPRESAPTGTSAPGRRAVRDAK